MLTGAVLHQKRTRALISTKRGELPAPTKEPSRLVGGPTAAMLEPNCGFEMSLTGWSKLVWLKALYACAPNDKVACSVMAMSFMSARSTSKKCGPYTELRPMVPKPEGVPLAAGANCEGVRQGEFTALVQVPGTAVTGEAKITPL